MGNPDEYQVTLGEHRETLHDKGDVTRDQVEDVIERMAMEMPDEVSAELSEVSTPSHEPTRDLGLVLPDLSN